MLNRSRIPFEGAPLFEVEQVANASALSRSAFFLPDLDKYGFLPPGIHHSSAAEISERFATSPLRRDLWNRSMTFLNRAAALGNFSSVYVAGGFISSKPAPSDVDIILEPVMPYGFAALKAMEPLFAQGLDKILVDFCVHLDFWCRGFPDGIWDRHEFFQRLKPTEALRLGLPCEARRGIVRMNLGQNNTTGTSSLFSN